MALQFLAIDTSLGTIDIGKYYAYLYHNRLCVGVAISHPSNKPGDGYTWAMRNCITGKVQYPYQKDVIVPNSEIKEVFATIELR